MVRGLALRFLPTLLLLRTLAMLLSSLVLISRWLRLHPTGICRWTCRLVPVRSLVGRLLAPLVALTWI